MPWAAGRLPMPALKELELLLELSELAECELALPAESR